MPHSRERYLSGAMRHAMASFPIIGLMGQRQVGKTTLATLHGEEYVTLDIVKNLEICDQDPELFLQNRKYPFVIDESQMSPALFPALKEAVRLLPKPGRFIITGSVRFSGRKQIRESLTGRIALLELLPMNITEAHEESLNPLPMTALDKPKAIESVLKKLASARNAKTWQGRISHFLETGGLPGVCFTRNVATRHQKFDSYLETILLRDLQLVIQTTISYASLRALVAQIALQQGLPLDVSDLSTQTGISGITVKKLLFALQALYLIREIPVTGGVKKSVFAFEDQGLAHHLMKGWQNPRQDFFRLLHANVRPQFLARFEWASQTQILHYKTRGGANLPLVFRTPQGLVAYTAVMERQATSSALLSAKSFQKHHPKAIIFIAHQGEELRQWGEGIWSVPLRLVL